MIWLLRLLLLAGFLSAGILQAEQVCLRTGAVCVDNAPRCITPAGGGACVTVTNECWEYQDTYECYGEDTVDSCVVNNTDLSGCYMQDTVCHETVNGECLKWTANYVCDEQWNTSCENEVADLFCNGDPDCDLTSYDCRQTGETCVAGPETRIIDGVPVFRECWDYEVNWECYTGEQSAVCSSDMGGCEVTGESCVATDPVDGRCTEWVERLVCPQDAVVSCNSSDEVTGECSTPYTTTCNETNEDGFCIDQATQQACVGGEPEVCDTDPACELVGTECISYTGDLCDAERQIYACEKQKSECVKEETTTTCADGDIVHGLDNVTSPPSTNRFGEAYSSMAILDAIQRDMTEDSISIFKGQGTMCEDPILSSWLTNDCCRMDVKDQGDNLLAQCTDYEIELAAAKRAKRTHYVGRWCSEELDLLFGSICLMKANGYCKFNSVLGRIIQEQGREQLAELASSGYAGSQTVHKSYNQYADTGSWLPVANVNGNQVTAYQWPAYCLRPEAETEELNSNPEALPCPMLEESWFAACADASGCGLLPADPRVNDSKWTLQYAAPDKNTVTTLSRYAVVAGSCTNNKCEYDFSAWPAGEGGSATIGLDLAWNLYGASSGWTGQIYQISNFQFEPYAFEPGYEPAAIPLRVSTDKGASFQTYTIPVDITDTNYSLPTNPEISIFGHCDTLSMECSYRVIVPINVKAKPWGEPQNPDCSGFTIEELSILDFEKMNLNEWLASDEVGLPDPAQMTAQLAEDVDTFYNTYNSGGTMAFDAPQGTKYFNVTPTEGVGPFKVEFQAAKAWPDNSSNDTVNSVQINWGDGSSSSATFSGDRYVATHTYPAAPGQDTTYTLSAKIQSNSGSHSASATIKNYTDTPSPGNSDQGGGYADDPYQYNPSRTQNGINGRNALPMSETYQEL